jgi:hypothetical protein
MSRPKQGIAERLKTANVAISNAMADTEIGVLLGEHGYKTPELSEGLALYEAADTAVKRQVAAEGGQSTASKRTDSAEKAARKSYQDLSQTARAVFKKNKAALSVLGLTGAMPKAMPLFLTMATALFDNASHDTEIAAVLAKRGYDADTLAKGRAKIVEMSAAMQAHQAAIGSAQQATDEQDIAMTALDDWMSEFLRIAKVALGAKPQLLEKLGVLRRNSKTKAQRKAPGKAAATRKAKKAAKPN